jgi:hypothetical protein
MNEHLVERQIKLTSKKAGLQRRVISNFLWQHRYVSPTPPFFCARRIFSVLPPSSNRSRPLIITFLSAASNGMSVLGEKRALVVERCFDATEKTFDSANVDFVPI